MNTSSHYLNPSEAARRIGVSTKALRIYETRGLMSPLRTEAGWRVYGPDDMARAAEIAALRRLGLSLAQVARVLGGDAADLDAALAAHAADLDRQISELGKTIDRVHQLRAELAGGKATAAGDVMRLLERAQAPCVTFDLPWPWGGERCTLADIRPIMYITGPLGSGKTCFARRIAEMLPDAAFLGLDRLDGGRSPPSLAGTTGCENIDAALAWIVDEGGRASVALAILIEALDGDRQGSLIVDMVEQGLDAATQTAVMSYLRQRPPRKHPMFLMTRSTAILDLDLVGAGEGIIYCPANHSPPLRVAPYAGAPGYEAVATCLATPAVRARTEGVIAWRPKAVS